MLIARVEVAFTTPFTAKSVPFWLPKPKVVVVALVVVALSPVKFWSVVEPSVRKLVEKRLVAVSAVEEAYGRMDAVVEVAMKEPAEGVEEATMPPELSVARIMFLPIPESVRAAMVVVAIVVAPSGPTEKTLWPLEEATWKIFAVCPARPLRINVGIVVEPD